MVSNDCKNRQPVHDLIEQHISAFLARGGKIEQVTDCRVEKTAASQTERNAATFLDANYDR